MNEKQIPVTQDPFMVSQGFVLNDKGEYVRPVAMGAPIKPVFPKPVHNGKTLTPKEAAKRKKARKVAKSSRRQNRKK